MKPIPPALPGGSKRPTKYNLNANRWMAKRRDGYRCVICLSEMGIVLHHILPSAEGGSDHVENLITLCGDCHKDIHHGPKHLRVTAKAREIAKIKEEYKSLYEILKRMPDGEKKWVMWQQSMVTRINLIESQYSLQALLNPGKSDKLDRLENYLKIAYSAALETYYDGPFPEPGTGVEA